MKITMMVLLFISLNSPVFASEVFTTFPDKIEADQKYVFYSHGYIVEGDNPKPIHPRWGVYDFPAIKEKLADENYNLIAYHRSKNIKTKLFVKKLVKDVQKLLSQGVKANNIYLLGFSQGGAISILTADQLANNKINLIILAGCSNFIKNSPSIKVYGRVLSIYETSDRIGSCQFLIDRSKDIHSFKEISISTGKEHGAFYQPIDEWIVPVKEWIKL